MASDYSSSFRISFRFWVTALGALLTNQDYVEEPIQHRRFRECVNIKFPCDLEKRLTGALPTPWLLTLSPRHSDTIKLICS
jgi:hypothetical protein